MNKLLGYLLIVGAVVIFGFRISKAIDYKQNVSGYLTRAANANTIELAEQELTKSINYLEANKMMTGYTSVFYETPDEDVDFWYKNLKAAQHELQTLNSSSALEKTNVLLKLRETIMSSSGKSSVTAPKGISAFPNNTMWAVLMLAAIIAGFVGFVILITIYDAEEKRKIKNEAKTVL